MSQVAILEPPRPEPKLSVRLEALTSALSAVDEALACMKVAIAHEDEDYYATGPAVAQDELRKVRKHFAAAKPQLERAEAYIRRAKTRTEKELHV